MTRAGPFTRKVKAMRPSPIRAAAAAAAAVGAGLATLAALAALAAAPVQVAGAASNGPSAQAEYNAAIKAVGAKGVHFESTALQNGVSLTVIGDTGTTSGAQKVTVKNGKTIEHMNALVVGSTGYIQANAAALHDIIRLTSSQSSRYANEWLSFPTSNSSLAGLVNGLLNSQVSTELQIGGPYSYGAATTVRGQHVVSVRGSVGNQNGSSVPIVVYIPATGAPLPVEEVTNPGQSGHGSAIHVAVTFSRWGETTTEKAPAHALSLLKIVPPTSGTTSTTAPTGG